MTTEAFIRKWGKPPEGWEGRRVSYHGGTKFDHSEDPVDGYSGEGTVTDEIPCPLSPPILNVDCVTHGPITVASENCAVIITNGA